MASVGGAVRTAYSLKKAATDLLQVGRKNVTGLGSREIRSAMLARAGVGAVGGGIYSYARGGDVKGGVMGGAFLGAGYSALGGRAGIGGALRGNGLLKQKAAQTVERKVAQSTSAQVVQTGSRVSQPARSVSRGTTQKASGAVTRDNKMFSDAFAEIDARTAKNKANIPFTQAKVLDAQRKQAASASASATMSAASAHVSGMSAAALKSSASKKLASSGNSWMVGI